MPDENSYQPFELTERQRAVIERMADNKSAKDIAAEFMLHPLTAKRYVELVLEKTGSSTAEEAVAKWLATNPQRIEES